MMFLGGLATGLFLGCIIGYFAAFIIILGVVCLLLLVFEFVLIYKAFRTCHSPLRSFVFTLIIFIVVFVFIFAAAYIGRTMVTRYEVFGELAL